MSIYPDSGTTLEVFCGFENTWYTMTLGDSRCYTIEGDRITRTRDHSLVEELYRKGLIDESEINTHPMKNMISAFIGGGHASKLRLENVDKWDRAVICSDGACGCMADREFAEYIRNVEDSESLVKTAFDKGSKDNITAILIKRR